MFTGLESPYLFFYLPNFHAKGTLLDLCYSADHKQISNSKIKYHPVAIKMTVGLHIRIKVLNLNLAGTFFFLLICSIVKSYLGSNILSVKMKYG